MNTIDCTICRMNLNYPACAHAVGCHRRAALDLAQEREAELRRQANAVAPKSSVDSLMLSKDELIARGMGKSGASAYVHTSRVQRAAWSRGESWFCEANAPEQFRKMRANATTIDPLAERASVAKKLAARGVTIVGCGLVGLAFN